MSTVIKENGNKASRMVGEEKRTLKEFMKGTL